jgi:hypothetical protein
VSPRLFQFVRFAVYAAVIAAGAYHLATRDDARGASAEPPGRWLRGETTRQLPVSVKVDDHRVVAVDVTWRASCDRGSGYTMTSGFVDAFEGDFERDGQRFADEWKQTTAGWRDQTDHLHARLRGEAAGGVARGSVDFELEIEQDGEIVQTCSSGPVGFAVDL